MFLLKIKKGFKTEVEISKGHTPAQAKKKTQDSIRFSSRRPPLNFSSLSAGIVKTKKATSRPKKQKRIRAGRDRDQRKIRKYKKYKKYQGHINKEQRIQGE